MKVYCRTCKHVSATSEYDNGCWHPDFIKKYKAETWYDYKSKIDLGDCREINKNNDCTRYEKEKVIPVINWIIGVGIVLGIILIICDEAGLF